jgi:hypothetical protein
LFAFMGWDRSLSDRASAPTYPCLIDERHIVAERYGMVNVPTAVWIDEDGFMARAPEPAGASDMFRGMNRETFEVPRDAAEAGKRTKSFYVEALCDWIERGKQSRHVLPPEEIRRRMRGRSRDDSTAAASFRLGLWLQGRGEREDAAKQFATAVRLRPESWNFRRQQIVLSDPALTGQFAATPEFWQAVDALGEQGYYYPPIRMEGIPPPPRPRRSSAGG